MRALRQPPPTSGNLRLVDELGGCGGAVVRAARGQQIARHLFAHETVPRQIRIECAHHPIAIAPSLTNRVVKLMTARLGPAHHIQPMARPVLAKAGLRQHLVHHLRTHSRHVALADGLHPRRIRRQAAHSKARATQPSHTRHIPRRRQVCLTMRGLNVAIRRRPGPACARRHSRLPQRHPRPMPLIRCTGLNPGAQGSHFLRCERFMPIRRRHALVLVRAQDAAQQLTLVGSTGHDGSRQPFLRSQRILAPIQTQARLAGGLIRPMTCEALGGQDGRHIQRVAGRARVLTAPSRGQHAGHAQEGKQRHGFTILARLEHGKPQARKAALEEDSLAVESI